MKETVAVAFVNDAMYYIGTDENGDYKLVNSASESTNFRWKFLFFNRKTFAEGIKNKLGIYTLAWIHGHLKDLRKIKD